MSLNDKTKSELDRFKSEQNVSTKGSLSVVLQLTRILEEKGLPADPEEFKTGKQGQVAGLGGGNLRKILAEHGISRQLSAEGGRTSRGSMSLMLSCVGMLNQLAERENVDLEAVEGYWVDEVRAFFRGKPFTLSADARLSLSSSFDELFEQAKRRQKENPGTQYLGTVLQHLVAAKLLLVLPEGAVEIHGASVADGPTGREGDFVIGNMAIHCTTAPASLLMKKCKANLRDGLRPIIVTIRDRVQTAWSLAEDEGLDSRIEVWDIQQFLATNAYERGLFSNGSVEDVVSEVIDGYNVIIDTVESDPSLKIRFDKNL